MNGSILLWVLTAIALCWGVGVYNRIMRLRARAIDALGSVGKLLRNYAKLLVKQCDSSQGAAGAEAVFYSAHLSPEWSRVAGHLDVMELALKHARNRPMDRDGMKTLSSSCAELSRAWGVLRAVPADLAGAAVPEEFAQAWEMNTQKVRAATGAFNQILAKYNEAITLFPAVALSGCFGFKSAEYLRTEHDT